METVADLDLAAIEARVEASTSGPWEHLTAPAKGDPSTKAEWMAHTLAGDDRLHVLTASGERGYAYIVPAVTGDGPTSAANADFIAHAREDVPTLVAEVRRLREALAEVAKHQEDMADSLDEHITHEDIHEHLLLGMRLALDSREAAS